MFKIFLLWYNGLHYDFVGIFTLSIDINEKSIATWSWKLFVQVFWIWFPSFRSRLKIRSYRIFIWYVPDWNLQLSKYYKEGLWQIDSQGIANINKLMIIENFKYWMHNVSESTPSINLPEISW
jgi:hypothetical protein